MSRPHARDPMTHPLHASKRSCCNNYRHGCSWRIPRCKGLRARRSQPRVLTGRKRLAQAAMDENPWIFLQACESFYCGESSTTSLYRLSRIPAFCPLLPPSQVLLRHLHSRRHFSFKTHPRCEKHPSAFKYHLCKSANVLLQFCGILVPLSLKITGV